jgi:hypothetical protein
MVFHNEEMTLDQKIEAIRQNTQISDGGTRQLGRVSRIRQDNAGATTNVTTATGYTNDAGLPMGGYHVTVGEIFTRVYPTLIAQHLYHTIVSDHPFWVVTAMRTVYNYTLRNGAKLKDVIECKENGVINAQRARALGFSVPEVQHLLMAYGAGLFEAAWEGGDNATGYSSGWSPTPWDPSLDFQGMLAWDLPSVNSVDSVTGEVTYDMLGLRILNTSRMISQALAGQAQFVSGTQVFPGNLYTQPSSIFTIGLDGAWAEETEVSTDVLWPSSAGSVEAGEDIQYHIITIIELAGVLFAAGRLDLATSATALANTTPTMLDMLELLNIAYSSYLRRHFGSGANFLKSEQWKLKYEPYWLRTVSNSGRSTSVGQDPVLGSQPNTTDLTPSTTTNAVFFNTGLVDNTTSAPGFGVWDIRNYVKINNEIPELVIVFDSESVPLTSRKLGASFSVESLAMADSLHGINLETAVMDRIEQEIRHNQDREALDLAKSLAVDLSVGGGQVLVVDLNDESNLGTTGSVININSNQNRVNKLSNALMTALLTVQEKTKIASGGGIITTKNVLAALQSANQYFTGGPENLNNIITTDIDVSSRGNAMAGKLNGTVPVYLDQFAHEDYALAFIKGPGQNAGVIRVDWSARAEAAAVEPNMFGKRVALFMWYGYTQNLLSAGTYFRLVKFRNLNMVTGVAKGRLQGW